MQPEAAFYSTSHSTKRADILSASIIVLFLFGWHWRVTGTLDTLAVCAVALFFGLCLAYGSIFKRLTSVISGGTAGLPYQFLCGYFVFNTLLFIVTLSSPLGMSANIALMSVVAFVGLLLTHKQIPVPPENAPVSDHWLSCAAVFISCVGATICCGDAQSPVTLPDGTTIYRIWDDVYIHAREISVFAQSHGISTIGDIKLAGGRTPIYHFASYLSPAVISNFTGASGMQVYASLQLPLGLVLTGLAAYCLFGKYLGAGPGLAAAVAIMIFPDAFQQGFQNRYLSYNFLAQVNLGMLYGIASAAMAWMFMFDGCRRGKIGPVLLGYIFLIVCLFYKAQLFVANSYLLMMFPFFFFKHSDRKWRIVLGLFATAVFCVAVSLGQSSPRVPVMRLDGSGIGQYIVDLMHVYDDGWMKRVFYRIFLVEQHGHAVQALYAVAMIGLSTFGLWLFGLAGALAKGWRKIPVMLWLFPILIIGNYMVMTLGLAYDDRKIGAPDELINRPLVWAYFVVAAFTAALMYRLVIGSSEPRGIQAFGVTLVSVFGIVAALQHAPNLQTYPQFGMPVYAQFGTIPKCLLAAATHLRSRSGKSDVVLDAVADPKLKLSALSERQLYVGTTLFGGVSDTQTRRLAETKNIVKMGDAAEIRHFFASNDIRWFLQHPDTQSAWPSSGLPLPEVDCGGYRLFHFPDESRAVAAH
jgi:hypothetical protein